MIPVIPSFPLPFPPTERTCEFHEIHPEFGPFGPRRREGELQPGDAAPRCEKVTFFELLQLGGRGGVVAAHDADDAVLDTLCVYVVDVVVRRRGWEGKKTFE